MSDIIGITLSTLYIATLIAIGLFLGPALSHIGAPDWLAIALTIIIGFAFMCSPFWISDALSDMKHEAFRRGYRLASDTPRTPRTPRQLGHLSDAEIKAKVQAKLDADPVWQEHTQWLERMRQYELTHAAQRAQIALLKAKTGIK